jgi:hypothetical protein
MRAYLLFIVSAFAAAIFTFAASGERLRPEPSETQMQASFSRFFSSLETKPVSEIKLAVFKKNFCKSSAGAGYYCSFTYATKLTAEQLSVLPTHGTVSGTFFADDDGNFRLEMAIG